MQNIKALAAGILMQAIKDYPLALEYDKRGIQTKECNLKELDKFFRSDWFDTLWA